MFHALNGSANSKELDARLLRWSNKTLSWLGSFRRFSLLKSLQYG
jgi:hypothetical protein